MYLTREIHIIYMLMKYLCQIYKAIKLSDFHWGTTQHRKKTRGRFNHVWRHNMHVTNGD